MGLNKHYEEWGDLEIVADPISTRKYLDENGFTRN
jgi:hypothetical protein